MKKLTSYSGGTGHLTKKSDPRAFILLSRLAKHITVYCDDCGLDVIHCECSEPKPKLTT